MSPKSKSKLTLTPDMKRFLSRLFRRPSSAPTLQRSKPKSPNNKTKIMRIFGPTAFNTRKSGTSMRLHLPSTQQFRTTAMSLSNYKPQNSTRLYAKTSATRFGNNMLRKGIAITNRR